MRIVSLVKVVLAVAAVGTCLPQEVPGLANIEILKIVPRRRSDASHEPLLPLTPTAADRRYDVMINYDDDYFDEYDGQHKPVSTTLERPQPLLTTDLSDYDTTLFQSDLRRESNTETVLATETLKHSLGPSKEFLPLFEGFEQEALGSTDPSRFVVAAEERIDPYTEEPLILKEQEGFSPGRKERRVPEIGDPSFRASKERLPGGPEDQLIPNTEEHFFPERGERIIPSTEKRFPLLTDERVIQDNKREFVKDTDDFPVMHHGTPVPDGIVQNLQPGTDKETVGLVTEGSMHHVRVVLPPYNALSNTEQQRIGPQYPAAFSTSPPQQAPYRPNHHSRSANSYFNDAQLPRRISPLSASLHDLYESRDTSNERSSRALYSHTHQQQESNLQPHRPQVSPHVSHPMAGKDTKPSIAEKSDKSFPTNRRDRALRILNPSYTRLVAAQQNMKRDRALKARPPAGSMSRDERAYYTGLQQEIERSDLLVEAIKDVRSREGKSIQDLRKRRKDTDNPKEIPTLAPDIQEFKQKFGSHPLYQDLPREEDTYLGVRDAGPLLHRDDYSSEQEEYEKMYLPVRAKSMELREIRKVKEHFHSLVPLKVLKNSYSTSPPRRKPLLPAVTTYKPPVLPEYLKHRTPTFVTTAKPYYKTGISKTKLSQNTIPPPPHNSRLRSGRPTTTPSRAPLPKPSLPRVTTSINSHHPRRSFTHSNNRTRNIRHLFYPITHTPSSLSFTPSTHKSHRSSRLYRRQEQRQSGFRNHHSRDIKNHRFPRYQHETPSSVKSSAGAAYSHPSPASYSLPDSQTDDPSSTLHGRTPIHHLTLGAKVRRKRGPDMEEYLDAKMKFPKYGYDIDPYFSDFPSFGFFKSDAEKGS